MCQLTVRNNKTGRITHVDYLLQIQHVPAHVTSCDQYQLTAPKKTDEQGQQRRLQEVKQCVLSLYIQVF